MLIVMPAMASAGQFCNNKEDLYCKNGYCNMTAIRDTGPFNENRITYKKGQSSQFVSQAIEDGQKVLYELHGSTYLAKDFRISEKCTLR